MCHLFLGGDSKFGRDASSPVASSINTGLYYLRISIFIVRVPNCSSSLHVFEFFVTKPRIILRLFFSDNGVILFKTIKPIVLFRVFISLV